MRKINIIVAAIILLAVLAIGAAALVAGPAAPQGDTTQDGPEVEDCDAEDFLNREDDCGFVSPKPIKTSAPKVAPKTGVTRR